MTALGYIDAPSYVVQGGTFVGDPNIVVVTDASGNLASSSTPSSNMLYLDNVTSDIQTQIDGKQPTFSGTPNTVVISDTVGGLATSTTNTTQLSFLNNLTGDIQTQLNGKEPTFTGTANVLVATDASGALTSSIIPVTEAVFAPNPGLTTGTFIKGLTSSSIENSSNMIENANDVIIQGVDSTGKFVVNDSSGTQVLGVDTTNSITNISTIQTPNLILQPSVDGGQVLTVNDANGNPQVTMTSSNVGAEMLFNGGTFGATRILCGAEPGVSGISNSLIIQTPYGSNGDGSGLTLEGYNSGVVNMEMNFDGSNLSITDTIYTYLNINTTTHDTTLKGLVVQPVTDGAVVNINNTAGTNILSINTSTSQVLSRNNILDDGSGNMYMGSLNFNNANASYAGLYPQANKPVTVEMVSNDGTNNFLTLRNTESTASYGSAIYMYHADGDFIKINAAAGGYAQVYAGSQTTNYVQLDPSATSWSAPSKKGLKTVVDDKVDHEKHIEALGKIPVDRWYYTNDKSKRENIGMYVEDVVKEFGLSNGEALTTQEVDGVLLSCLKGMYIKHQKLEGVVNQLLDTVKKQQDYISKLETKLVVLGSGK